MNLPDNHKVKTICCLILADIGDIMVCTPTITAIKERYPNAVLSVIVRKQFARLLKNNPNVDELIEYNQASSLTKLSLLLRLFIRRCDLWFDLHVPTFNTISSNDSVFSRNELLRRVLRPRYSVGYRLLVKQKLSHPLPVPSPDQLKRENIVQTTLRLIEQEDHYHRFPKLFRISSSELAWATGELAQCKGMKIGLFFGSKQSADIWPQEHIEACIRMLLTKIPGAHLILIGGKLEQTTAQQLLFGLTPIERERVLNFCGKSDLGQSAALISQCTLLISTDAGPLHLADALQVPIVALFSSKNYPTIWQPMYSQYRLLNQPMACGPCFSATCSQSTSCMSLIRPEQVLAATLSLNSELETKAS